MSANDAGTFPPVAIPQAAAPARTGSRPTMDRPRRARANPAAPASRAARLHQTLSFQTPYPTTATQTSAVADMTATGRTIPGRTFSRRLDRISFSPDGGGSARHVGGKPLESLDIDCRSAAHGPRRSVGSLGGNPAAPI